MLRKLLIAFGCYEIAKPQPVIDACERIGLENPDDAQLRPRALWGARLEGLLFVWVLVRGREGSTLVSTLLGAAGLALLAVPRPFIDLSQRLVYENADDLELKPWVKPAARALGALYLLVVVLSTRGDESTAASEDATATA
ncbi:hypothetical protein [Natronolimnohabitans innermongolicus]|uniref:Uncharacterized protein n=1 Tax=Natronolimnohabitans innermongolicus JCM 12255 TaxID=1227499 RepID=L9X1C1_9EURY|nr:hypothetical protein [Natronolimnohabitans innermongolicus]ELY55549.1 hypothetical protein C493_11317 [Natronolimnohabitans innermongolicus JCM 12255]